MKVQTIVEIIKETLVEAASAELISSGETVTPSRISVMTGLHRQDINRINSGESGKKGADTLTRIIGQWRNDKRFLTETGRPKSLTLSAKSGTFVDLVSSVSKDVNPYTVALELERLGLARREAESLILSTREYLPRKNLIATGELLGADIHDLIRSAESNVIGEESIPHLHLTTRYDNVRLEALPKIQKWLMNEGAKFHKRARDYLSTFDLDINPGTRKSESGGGYVALGTFSLTSGKNNKQDETNE